MLSGAAMRPARASRQQPPTLNPPLPTYPLCLLPSFFPPPPTDEHYIPTLLASQGLEHETYCDGWGLAYTDWRGQAQHPRSFMPKDVGPALVKAARWQCRNMREAVAGARGARGCAAGGVAWMQAGEQRGMQEEASRHADRPALLCLLF